MIISVRGNGMALHINSLTENNTGLDLKKEIIKKIDANIPLNKIKLTTGASKIIDDSKTLKENNIWDGSNIDLSFFFGNFGETRPKNNDVDFDINSFILDTIDTQDIVFVSWGNYISNQSLILSESRSTIYSDWHNVFRQQLPLPLLEYGVKINKNINMYSIDQGFEEANHFDIRHILKKYVEPIIINGIELYKLNTCDILNEIGIECPYSDSIISLYFMKYTYGYCNSNKSDFVNIDLCLNELKQNLNQMGVEYYIYRHPMDIDTLITNNDDNGNDIKQWFQNGGKKGKKKTKTVRREPGSEDLVPFLGKGSNYPNCCDNIDNHNYCLRISDNKKFKLPRKFKKQDCLKDKKIKSFSKRSSCAPFKDCKKTKKKSIKRKKRKNRKSKKRKNSRKKRSKKKK
jgi:hypothetical protein